VRSSSYSSPNTCNQSELVSLFFDPA